MNNNSFPPEIIAYLNEIADRLQSHHASVMIGAGFSKNAETKDATKHFLSWNELSDKFLDQLNISDKPRKYLNVLKVANEVEAVFGRPTLEKIIKTNTPDKEFKPSDLHIKLLNLPWVDVFTTNYDTLLERAADSILRYRYETIINKEDLISSTKPRIIKLHGSFPSERPFIITEEDYRTYPSKFAPFVNTVQQSLLENTLCLIGFSGDDPNFLNWIGWIRDNLGKENSPKIYLIGVLSLYPGQSKLLEERNIVPINLSCISENPYKALSEFIDYLTEHSNQDKRLTWVKDAHFPFEPTMEQIRNAIKAWQSTRSNYPNWQIMPSDYRKMLTIHLDSSFIYHIEKIEKPFDIEIVYEFNWRIEKTFYPVFSEWAKAFRTVVDFYNPFPDIITTENTLVQKDNNEFDWENIKTCWIEIQLSLLAYYRQEGEDKEWAVLFNRFNLILNYLSPEQYARFHYECCLNQLFNLDIAATREQIKLWDINQSLPYWEAKRGGLLAELGDLAEAQSILENSLKEVRGRLSLSPVKNDYINISQEAYILQLLDYVQNSVKYSQREYSHDQSRREEYRKRWRQIIEYECDPWGELDFFESMLKGKQPPYQRITKTYSFDIGSQITTEHMGSDIYTIQAYSFLKYMEETGIPFRLPGITMGKDAATHALERIADYSPNWALVTLIRTGEEKNIESIFGRKAMVTKVNPSAADTLAKKLLVILEKSKADIKNGNIFVSTFAIKLASLLPLILSRLCVKNSYNMKVEMLSFVKNVYRSESRNNYKDIWILLKNLIKSFSNQEQEHLFHSFLEFPVICDDGIRFKYPDPFSFINIDSTVKKDMSNTIDNVLIENMFSVDSNVESNNKKQSSNMRKKCLTRLIVLWKYKYLSDEQIKLLADFLWAKTRTDGFPADLDFYNFAFLSFPYPNTIDVKTIFEKYIHSIEMPIQDENKGISVCGGDFNMFHDILGAINTKEYNLTSEELNRLLDKLIDWWNKDKHYLKQYKHETDHHMSIFDEFKSRFANMIRIFIYVFQPNIHLVDENHKFVLFNLLNELEEYDLSDISAKASFLKIFPEMENEIIGKIENTLLSRDDNQILDGVNGLIVIMRQNKDVKNNVNIICQNIKLRSAIGLKHFLDTAKIILDRFTTYVCVDMINDINTGLSKLLDETIVSSDDSDAEMHRKLQCRISGIHLIFSLKKYYNIQKWSYPDYVRSWERICLDDNECSEIRNAWKNAEWISDQIGEFQVEESNQ